MPTQLELRAEPRTLLGKRVRRLRRAGLVPANIYGHGPSRAIQAPLRVLEHVLAQGGRTGIIAIALDGGSQTALLKEIQRDPRSGAILHVEFRAVSLEESVSSLVPLRFAGEAPAVTKLGGVMTHPRSEVHVTARAADLPDVIEVDVSGLDELHAAIHVGDLAASATYTITDPAEEVVALVLPPKVEAEEAAEAAEAATATAETATAEAEAAAGASQEASS
ncbi:MAG: 50S ribosomal protein L25 [Chloroflexota bacterium]|nr:50S ribosomal protein L25 [Chloroflexota bacterium]